MFDNVIEFTGETSCHINPKNVVRWADDLKEAVVIGFDQNNELYVAGSSPDIKDVVYLLQLANKYMLELGDD